MEQIGDGSQDRFDAWWWEFIKERNLKCYYEEDKHFAKIVWEAAKQDTVGKLIYTDDPVIEWQDEGNTNVNRLSAE